MNWLTVLLRLVHIVAGVYWAGAAFAFARFVAPAVQLAGPEGTRFMQALTGKTRFAVPMAAAALLSTGAGPWLFWRDSGGFRTAWLSTPTGLALGVGGLAGVVAAVIGIAVQFRSTLRLQAIAAEIQAPNEAQAKEISRLQGRLRSGGNAVAGLLVVTVALMATARYLAF